MGSYRGRRLALPLYASLVLCACILAVEMRRPAGYSAPQALLVLYTSAMLAACPWGLLLSLLPLPPAREMLPRGREALPLSLWLVPPLFALVLIDRVFDVEGLVALVVLAKIGDNAGYFVGRAIGKRHPFPRISPGKTVAGCVASLVAGVAGGAVVLPLTLGAWTPSQVTLGAALGGLINVAAQAGDLSESWVKRKAGVKDSSTLVGPSGGVLDVIDSLLLAAPVALVSWSWVY